MVLAYGNFSVKIILFFSPKLIYEQKIMGHLGLPLGQVSGSGELKKGRAQHQNRPFWRNEKDQRSRVYILLSFFSAKRGTSLEEE